MAKLTEDEQNEQQAREELEREKRELARETGSLVRNPDGTWHDGTTGKPVDHKPKKSR